MARYKILPTRCEDPRKSLSQMPEQRQDNSGTNVTQKSTSLPAHLGRAAAHATHLLRAHGPALSQATRGICGTAAAAKASGHRPTACGQDQALSSSQNPRPAAVTAQLRPVRRQGDEAASALLPDCASRSSGDGTKYSPRSHVPSPLYNSQFQSSNNQVLSCYTLAQKNRNSQHNS